MARPHVDSDQTRSDADVRGEHDYAAPRVGTAEPPAEGVLRHRRPGHYVAGAEGTQDVTPARKTRRLPRRKR
jgi:hypothetical protein